MERRRPIHVSQRLAVFVDVQNMFYSARALYQRKLNFQQLAEKVTMGRRMIRALAYIVQTPEIDQSSFINFLHQVGYEVKSKELKKRPDGSAKGDWDMGIAIDSISLMHRVDVVALVSGDGDFCDLVRHLKAHGVRVEVYGFAGSTSEELRLTASEFIPLDADVLLYE
ncbi:MAG: NYN domain-containing protein [bacterium]